MELTLATPALLFPAISLLFLAYTNRFIALANVIRNLHAAHMKEPNPKNVRQIQNLRRRVRIIQRMQEAGVLSFVLCVISMGLLFFGYLEAGGLVFGGSLGLLGLSLGLAVVEIHISVQALDIHLSDIEGSLP